jgi:quinoprotein glucose dehydrogenase
MFPASICVHLRLILLVLLFVFLSWPVSAQTANSEWRYYGGDEGGSRFSPLAQINTSNVQSLKRAWTYHTGELDLGLRTASFQASFSCTPLVVDGVMYLSTPSSRVIALNAETGRELWKFDPQANKTQREFNSHRGVAYWEDKKTSERRILFGTVDGRLIDSMLIQANLYRSLGLMALLTFVPVALTNSSRTLHGERV